MASLKEYFKYKKFSGSSHRILFLDHQYFLQEQSVRCFRALGHQVKTIPVNGDPKLMLDKILRASVEFKPDCIMTMNHQGFDRDGQIISILEEFSVPVIIWYLDDFRFILPDFEQQAHENILIFSFEMKNIVHLQSLGFKNAHYLPTATILDPQKTYYNNVYEDTLNSTVFVGNSFEETKSKWHKPAYTDLSSEIRSNLNTNLTGNAFFNTIDTFHGYKFSTETEFYHYCGYLSAIKTQEYRKQMLSQVKAEDLIIYGDQYWNVLLPGRDIREGIHQEKEAPYLYNKAGVNLNISSVQLDTAVNMRVFDVPASGGFLLTDHKESLSDIFKIGEEVIVYHEKTEMLDKISYYMNNKSARDKIVGAARLRIQKEHLLEHRIQEILQKTIKIFKNF